MGRGARGTLLALSDLHAPRVLRVERNKTIRLHKDSHLDHGLTAAQLAHVLLTFAERDGFFIETIKLPESLGTVPCNLYGPIMGDPPISTDRVLMSKRGERAYESRVMRASALDMYYGMERRTSEVTIIAGPHDGLPCVLFTVFGGPLTPKEPNDPTLTDDKRDESIAFWSDHALAVEP